MKLQLNAEQALAAYHGTGPLRIVALAGSGKSSTLVERVAHLVEHHRVPPSQILMITFSKTARDEVAKRLDNRLPGLGASACARTFHSIGLEIYRQENMGRRDFTIDTSGRLFSMACREACAAKKLPPKRAALIRLSGLIKNNMLGGDPVARRLGRVDPRMIKMADQVARDMPTAQLDGDTLLQLFFDAERIRTDVGVFDQGVQQKFVTFDDMIYEAAIILGRKSAKEAWGKRWRYVLQDEAQDVNAAQMAIANALVSEHRNYTVCGDPSQAVYAFRGTSPESILDFDKTYAGTTTILMHRNYRSGIEICALASRILDAMPANSLVVDDFGNHAEMYSERQTHAYVVSHHHPTRTEEAERVADNIIAHRAAQVPWEEQAILVRMNRMTRDIEISLAQRQIPYRLVSGSSFFTMSEALCLLGYLRIIAGRATAASVIDTLRLPSRKLRKVLLDDIAAGHAVDEDWIDTARRVAAEKGKPHEVRAVADWARCIEAEYSNLKRPPGDLCERLRKVLKLDDYFGGENEDSEDSQSKENLAAVVRFAKDFGSIDELLDLLDLVEAHRESTGTKRKAVVVSTVHRAKGREWSIVYGPCLAQGELPASRADVAEERRVFYVLCTRAKDELWLSWSPTWIGKEDEPRRSQFLDEVELPETADYVVGAKVEATRVGSQLSLL